VENLAKAFDITKPPYFVPAELKMSVAAEQLLATVDPARKHLKCLYILIKLII